jgi:hypothetical protein
MQRALLAALLTLLLVLQHMSIAWRCVLLQFRYNSTGIVQ